MKKVQDGIAGTPLAVSPSEPATFRSQLVDQEIKALMKAGQSFIKKIIGQSGKGEFSSFRIFYIPKHSLAKARDICLILKVV